MRRPRGTFKGNRRRQGARQVEETNAEKRLRKRQQ